MLLLSFEVQLSKAHQATSGEISKGTADQDPRYTIFHWEKGNGFSAETKVFRGGKNRGAQTQARQQARTIVFMAQCSHLRLLWAAFPPPTAHLPRAGEGFSPSLWKKVRGGFSWKRGFLEEGDEEAYISACLSRWLRADERGLLLEEGPPQSSNQPG